MTKIDIYTTPICPYCIRAKRLLKAKGMKFTEINVMGNSTMRQKMMTRANGGHTVPQIFVGDIHVGGCDELFALDRVGKLDQLLAA